MDYRQATNSKGVDLSHYQPNFNWATAVQQGIQFAFFKATQGTTSVDDMLLKHYNNAKANGVLVGFYAFAAWGDPVAEANHYLQTVSTLECDLFYVLDAEDNPKGLSKAQISQWCRTWLQTVQQATGKLPMIYTGASFAKTNFESDLSQYPLWVAQYGIGVEPVQPSSNPVWDNWLVFQYSEKGSVGGISPVDLDEWNGDVRAWYQAQNNNVEDDENMPMKLEQWNWDMLAKSLDGLYKQGLISDYSWAEKASNQQLTAAEVASLNTILFARQNGVEV